MRVLITGGAGFIGSWLAFALLLQRHEVVIVDNLSTGDPANLLQGVVYPGPIDISSDHSDLGGHIEWCDCVYHLAAVVGVRRVVQDPERARTVNVLGTEAVLRLARKYHKPLLFTSSSEVYGNLDSPLSEECATESSSSLTLLGGTKWAAERLAIDSARRGGSIIIARLFNVVGARQTWRYGMVLPTFVKQALRGEEITVYGNGGQCRSFTDVRDVVKALISLMRLTGADAEIVNIGGERCTSVEELARLVKDSVKSDSRIVHIPYELTIRARYPDVKTRIPDLSKARKLIGYRTEFLLMESIANVVEYLRSKGVKLLGSDSQAEFSIPN